MKALLEYQPEFNELVDVAYHAYHGRWSPASNQHSIRLRGVLQRLADSHPPGFSLEREDIAQGLTMVWLELLLSYQNRSTDMGLRSYLLTLSVFKLRDWLGREMRTPVACYLVAEEDELPFLLDIRFLIRGSDHYPLSILTPYERYLIFLKFKEDKTILDIAGITQQSRQTVSTHLNKVIHKLRRATHVERKDSSRSSTASTRSAG